MESYPPQFLVHLAPLVIVQGLDATASKVFPGENEDLSANPLMQQAEPIFRKSPVISEIPFVEDAVKIWRKYHVDGVMWDSASTKSQAPTHQHRYRFKLADNSYVLPKKEPLEQSPLSILVEGSPVYPDGILTLDWLQKHRSITPALFIAFYEMDGEITDAQDIERIDTELASEINILKDQLIKSSTRMLAIVVSSRSTALNPELEERINTIRKMTGLNSRNGLLFLPSSAPKEVTSFALDVLQIIKPVSIEFYTNLDKRIRKKRSKVIGMVPPENTLLKFLIEARYSLKLGIVNEIKQQYAVSIKAFESAYESLIEIFSTLPMSHANWSQFRLLLDVTIFHVVRLYLYNEQPNLAYKKFDIHIQSVVYFLKLQKVSPDSYSVCNWLSLQFKWLAQLSDLAPVTLIPSEVPFIPEVSDRLSSLVLPHSGYLYLQSADILRRREVANKDLSLQDLYSSSLGSDDFKVSLTNLLTFSKLAFQKKDNTFNRSIGYVNYQLAEENFKSQDYEKAFKLYEQSCDVLKEDDWDRLLGAVYCKLFQCCIELKKYYPSVLNLLELGLIPQSLLDPEYENIKKITNRTNGSFKLFLDEEGDVTINAPTDSNFDLFECEVLFKSGKVPLTNQGFLQLKLTSKLNNVMDFTVIDDLLISFDNSQSSLLIKHDEVLHTSINSETQTLQYNNEKDCFVGAYNLSFKPYEEKIIKLAIPTKKIGRHFVTSVSGVFLYHDYFKVNINIPVITKPLQYRHIWHNDSGIEEIVATTEPCVYEVVPRAPDTKITVGEVPAAVISGERLSLPIQIFNTDHEVVDLKLTAVIIYSESETACTWGESSEEHFEIKCVEKEKEITTLLLFTAPRVSNGTMSSIKLCLTTTFIVNNDEAVPIVDEQVFDLQLVDPLKVSMTVFPRLQENDLPRVFEVEDGDPAVPKPARFWLMRATIVLNEEQRLALVGDDLDLKVENAGMVCKEEKSLSEMRTLENKKIQCDHYVETAIEDGHTYRNISFEACISLKWKRKGSDVINIYKHEPWKLSLPLLDPRVLLQVEPTEENNDLKLIYMLENPTSRVFSFSTTLIENQSFQVTGTKSLSQISVLPCTRQEVVFHATPLETGWVQLPQLKVYDLNYRVNLPTLPITDSAQAHKNEVYTKIDTM